MKNYLTLTLLSLALAVSAKAAIVTGASAGYLTDSKTGYYAARLGYQFKSASPTAQIVELEVGYTTDSDFGIKLDLVPVMLNYRAEIPTAEKFGVYVGAGLGEANVDVKTWWTSANDWAFAYQAFAGATYKLNDSTKLTLGGRYLKIENVRMFGSSIEVGDDAAIEAGISVKF